ncbi:MAG: xanthine dehydrogenase family protein subunit M [Alphaproteobacteria bacterium]|nr:xanthine dehydrogenase family protein subunit M [Alphaproteobacteria bacterium]
MKPAPFRYVPAASLEEALALKAEHGDEAKFLAGGQSLIPAMNFRMAQPAILIDINPLTALSYVRQDGNAIRVGALTRYRTLQRDAAIAGKLPLMAEALPEVAHPAIRNRGTLGGNLSHADPASELPAVVSALGGTLHTRSKKGTRRIAAQDFFTAALTTALTADELLTEIELPVLPPRSGTSFLEVARRRGDYAMMGVACAVTLNASGACAEARLAYCNAGETAMLAPKAAAALKGQRIDDKTARAAAERAKAEINPFGNVHASADYQRHLAGVLTRRALLVAAERAGA